MPQCTIWLGGVGSGWLTPCSDYVWCQLWKKHPTWSAELVLCADRRYIHTYSTLFWLEAALRLTWRLTRGWLEAIYWSQKADLRLTCKENLRLNPLYYYSNIKYKLSWSYTTNRHNSNIIVGCSVCLVGCGFWFVLVCVFKRVQNHCKENRPRSQKFGGLFCVGLVGLRHYMANVLIANILTTLYTTTHHYMIAEHTYCA